MSPSTHQTNWKWHRQQWPFPTVATSWTALENALGCPKLQQSEFLPLVQAQLLPEFGAPSWPSSQAPRVVVVVVGASAPTLSRSARRPPPLCPAFPDAPSLGPDNPSCPPRRWWPPLRWPCHAGFHAKLASDGIPAVHLLLMSFRAAFVGLWWSAADPARAAVCHQQSRSKALMTAKLKQTSSVRIALAPLGRTCPRASAAPLPPCHLSCCRLVHHVRRAPTLLRPHHGSSMSTSPPTVTWLSKCHRKTSTGLLETSSFSSVHHIRKRPLSTWEQDYVVQLVRGLLLASGHHGHFIRYRRCFRSRHHVIHTLIHKKGDAFSRRSPSLPTEDARHRPIRLRTIRLRPAGRNRIGRSRNLPKTELAEVEINWPKSNKWCLLCFFFLSFFFFPFTLSFYFSFLFFLFLLVSLFILFLFCFCFGPEKPELNPKPRTLHPISGEPPSAGQPPPDNLRRTTLPRTTLRRTTLRRTAQNFALFFPPPATIFILLSLSWGPFVEFCWCFWRPEPWNVHIWALGLSCETPAAPPDRAAGARTRQPENSKRAHFRAPALQTPPKFHVRRGKKKREILPPPPFGALPFGAPPFGAPPFGAPLFLAKLAEVEIGRSRSRSTHLVSSQFKTSRWTSVLGPTPVDAATGDCAVKRSSPPPVSPLRRRAETHAPQLARLQLFDRKPQMLFQAVPLVPPFVARKKGSMMMMMMSMVFRVPLFVVTWNASRMQYVALYNLVDLLLSAVFQHSAVLGSDGFVISDATSLSPPPLQNTSHQILVQACQTQEILVTRSTRVRACFLSGCWEWQVSALSGDHVVSTLQLNNRQDNLTRPTRKLDFLLSIRSVCPRNTSWDFVRTWSKIVCHCRIQIYFIISHFDIIWCMNWPELEIHRRVIKSLQRNESCDQKFIDCPVTNEMNAKTHHLKYFACLSMISVRDVVFRWYSYFMKHVFENCVFLSTFGYDEIDIFVW